MSGDILKVGEVAQLVGISASMVRFWERLGLVKPARTESKYRLYTDADVRLLRRATYLRKIQGLNVPAIIQLLRQEGLLNDRPAPRTEERLPIGIRFRQLRRHRGKSLSLVAKAVGLSEGFLSNLERSRNEPSRDVCVKLARYFGLNVADFLNPIDVTGPLVRAQDRKSLRNGPGVHVEVLASGKLAMEPQLFRIAPGASSRSFSAHEGEEFLYIMRGRLKIELGTQEFHLRSGDGFYFNSSTQHRWSNPGKTETIALWIDASPNL
jgi:DNA-binding transcriptional MerR regulator/mannose-6-phosphate isomerase-like protein (cupin superfamily)